MLTPLQRMFELYGDPFAAPQRVEKFRIRIIDAFVQAALMVYSNPPGAFALQIPSHRGTVGVEVEQCHRRQVPPVVNVRTFWQWNSCLPAGSPAGLLTGAVDFKIQHVLTQRVVGIIEAKSYGLTMTNFLDQNRAELIAALGIELSRAPVVGGAPVLMHPAGTRLVKYGAVSDGRDWVFTRCQGQSILIPGLLPTSLRYEFTCGELDLTSLPGFPFPGVALISPTVLTVPLVPAPPAPWAPGMAIFPEHDLLLNLLATLFGHP